MLRRWRARYREAGVAGLRDRPRPGQPRRLSPEKAQDILRWTVERIPHEATHWSLRLMPKHAGVSQWHVAQVWQAERRAVRRGSFTSVAELRAELRRFIAAHNKYAAKPFRWTKPAAVILAAAQRAEHAMRINSAGH